MSRAIRRVVTGHDVNGKAVIASDELVSGDTSRLNPGDVFYRLWGWDVPPRLPDDGHEPTTEDFYPPRAGARFVIVNLADGTTRAELPRIALADLIAEYERLLPGAAQYIDPATPRFHRTPTVDFAVVLSGRVELELDSGDRTTLSAGDTIVQNGTSHAWINIGPEPTQLGLFMAGVAHSHIPDRKP